MSIERLQEKNEELFDGLTEEAKSIALPLVPSPMLQEPANVQK